MSFKYILGLNQMAKGQKYKMLVSDKESNIILRWKFAIKTEK